MMTFWIFSDLRFLSFPFYLGLAPFPHTFRVRWVSVPNRNVWPRNKEKNRKKAKKPLKLPPLPLPLPHIFYFYFFWVYFELISCGCCKPSVCRFVIGRVYQMRDSFLLDNPRCPTRSRPQSPVFEAYEID